MADEKIRRDVGTADPMGGRPRVAEEPPLAKDVTSRQEPFALWEEAPASTARKKPNRAG